MPPSPLTTLLVKKQKFNTCRQSYSVLVTFKEIADIVGNKNKYKLLDPPFQIAQDQDKISEMIEAYNKNPQFILSKAVLTLADVMVDNITEIYLMDGQHRMEMIKKIYENTNDNHNMIVVVHSIYSEDEMRLLFDELNKDSSKNEKYVSLEIFGKKKVEIIKKTLLEKYVGTYAKSKNIKSSLYTVDEFINELIDNEFFENDKSIQEILHTIESTHKKFFAKLEYLENSDNDKLYTQTEMTSIKEHKNVMFFKNNNFICHLVDNCNIPCHEDLIKRTKISEKMRLDVWQKKFFSKKTAICPVKDCDCNLENKKFGFQCGHIISVANGGKTTLDNLIPMCANCNSKMSSTNLDDYEEELEREKVWSKECDSDDDCECSQCGKIVTKETFYVLKKSGKKGKEILKIACRKCNKIA